MSCTALKRLLPLALSITVSLFMTLAILLPCAHASDEPPDRVLKKGHWELQLFYRFKGTPSEGQ